MSKQIDMDGRVLHEWRHYLTDDEILDRKDFSVKVSDEIDKIEEEKKVVMNGFKNQLKEIKRDGKKARLELKAGYIDKCEKVKPVLDFANGIVEFFDRNGDKVDERKLTKQEIREGNLSIAN